MAESRAEQAAEGLVGLEEHNRDARLWSRTNVHEVEQMHAAAQAGEGVEHEYPSGVRGGGGGR
eukprot:16444685-Heterocapsa_arctica.AAC.1